MISRSGREKILPLLLVGALLLCHGVFGPLHLVCASPECVEGAAHPAGHHSAAGTMGHAHENPVGHATSADYFAVVAGLLGLLVGSLRTGTWTKERPGSRRAIRSFREHRVFRPARAPTSRVLQVFRL
jgi:hypothetical protein